MNRAILFFISALFFWGCQSNKLTLKSRLTKQPIIIKYSKEYNSIYGIKIPIQLDITNESIYSKSFITIDYKYNPYNKGVGEEIYIINDSIYKIKNNKKKTVPSLGKNNYIVYSRYRIDRFDTENIYQQQFKPYIKKMLEENKDTLHIGTVGEFKTKHAALFEKLTKNDSISIQFLDGRELGERITVPVEW
ncbi:hypothetical protein [Zobellia galactanivorans]|uniref:hypothetical protein n=1 Tax=Zobellia galactanivorans (strain DSM 12802 / CCUG 47099 / CIP 106680 / NCIMB 13871 / Dsij) TaxID=63186 RepID=UPI001C0785B5|nr:hypothetical protein [Zobellia galactanivorans]MBU3026006.1 hypothetical protein [Zobellia galactanivorans]